MWISPSSTPKAGADNTGYLAEDGPFANNSFERLGGVGVFKVDLPAQGLRYRFALYENPRALPSVALPPEIAKGCAPYDASLWE